MCGIIGYVGSTREGEWTETHGLLTELLVQSIERGRDATGFAAITEPLDNPRNGRLITDKQPLVADEFVARNPFWRHLRHLRCRAMIGHVRASTSGSPAVNTNNHPHEGIAGASRFSLVHNGWYTNIREIQDRDSLHLRTDCDSELAVRMIERVGSIPEGMRLCLEELRGAQALAVLDHRTGIVFLCRDSNRPLWVCRLKDKRRVLFASTPSILARAIEKRLGKLNDWVFELTPLAAGYVFALTHDLRLFTVVTAAAVTRESGVD